MSDLDHPDNMRLAALGNLAIQKHIREMREEHSEENLVQIMDGVLIATFGYFAHDVGNLDRIEDLVRFWNRRLHPEEALRNIETEGQA